MPTFGMLPEVDTVLKEESGVAARAKRLVEAVAHQLPGHHLYGCRLHDGARPCTYVADEEGRTQTELDIDWEVDGPSGGAWITPIEHDGNYYGELLIGGSNADDCEEESRKAVATMGKYIAVCFRLEGEQKVRQGLEAALGRSHSAQPQPPAKVAQVCHDVRNVLNNIILQVSILKTKVPSDSLPILEMLREQILKAGGMLRAVEQGTSAES